MKESIEFNYNILIDELIDGESSNYFLYNNKLYLLVPFIREENEIRDIIECSKELKEKNIISFDIILNKDKKVITTIEKVNYILMHIPNNYKEELDIIDIMNFNNKTKLDSNKKKLYKNNWKKLWSEKIDYFEYQVSELAFEKKIIIDSFSYFIGLAENAISLVDKISKENEEISDSVCLCHRRIFYPNIVLNYCNPISYLIDLEVRDVAEYLKSSFYSGDDSLLELNTYLKSVKLSHYSYQMLYARLVFPSVYFDLYENAINNKDKEEKIISVIKKINRYEQFLKNANELLNKYSKVEQIDWLK